MAAILSEDLSAIIWFCTYLRADLFDLLFIVRWDRVGLNLRWEDLL